MKDKLFFFGAQEWVDYYAVQTAVIAVPTEKMRTGDFSELLSPTNGFFSGARVITDPLTGQPFPGNVIPANRLSANGLAILNAYPAATPGFRQGSANALITSPNPQDQRKDNIRLDYRMNASNNFAYRYSRYNWTAVDAFRGNLPFARTGLGSAQLDPDRELDEHADQHARQRVRLHVFQGRRVHRPLHGDRRLQAQQVRDQLPVHLPGEGDLRQDSDGPASRGSSRLTAARTPRRRRARSTRGPNTTTWVQGPSHVQGRHPGRVLGRGRLRPDQRQRRRWRHQQPERPLRLHGRPLRRHRAGHRQRRAGAVQQLRGTRRAQLHRVAVAGDRPLRAGLLEADREADGRRRRSAT